MKPAFAAIPEVYVQLAMANDAWYWFVTATGCVIHAMQLVERLVIGIVTWPFNQLVKALRDRDGMLIEHSSATSAGLMAVWAYLGREPDEAYRVVTTFLPYGLVVALAAALCVYQFVCASRGAIASRGTALVLACGYWSFLSIVLFIKTGFLLFHVFSAPLAVLCSLCAWLLWEQIDGPANKSTTSE